MQPVQIPTKLRRNAPCHCGSGRKFKKCCLPKEQKVEEGKITVEDAIEKANAPRLKNDFRDEVRDPYARIPEDELVTRDQAVLLRELRFRALVNMLNRKTLGEVVENAKAMRITLMGMPKSPYREVIIADLTKTIENNQNQIKAIELPISIKITLLALEELLEPVIKGVAEALQDAPRVSTEDDDGAMKEEAAGPEESVPPELSDDDDENPEEAI